MVFFFDFYYTCIFMTVTFSNFYFSTEKKINDKIHILFYLRFISILYFISLSHTHSLPSLFLSLSNTYSYFLCSLLSLCLCHAYTIMSTCLLYIIIRLPFACTQHYNNNNMYNHIRYNRPINYFIGLLCCYY